MILPVIMAGGSGTRLWPLSRENSPKQFLRLASEESMFQSTISRLKTLDIRKSLIICNEEHRFIVAEQLREMSADGDIILEPIGRNTAPAIALAANFAIDQSEEVDPLLLVLAADHVIQDEDAFIVSVNKGIHLANEGKLVTFGIIPTEPHTGYGYIKRGLSVDDGFLVDKFVEKPNAEIAQGYLDSGRYYWNSGMFLIKASRYLEELKHYCPDISQACSLSIKNKIIDLDFIRVDKNLFMSCPSESIDTAVMEKTSDAVVVPLDAGWNDIGSWSALWDIGEKCESGNVTFGDVIQYESKNCYVHGSNRLITTVGLDSVVIVETKDAILVASKDKVQDVKKIVEKLKLEHRSEYKSHREVFRPWGKFDSIDVGERYQVKRITVNPGAKLSLQMHHHRAEHWVVVSGTAKVTNGDKTLLVTEDQSTYIPIGIVHALENPGKLPLELIEVQSGSYLKEDDIVRFEDRYGRV